MAPAATFNALVDLLRKAEDALVKKAGQNDPADRACTLRGIYYGTEWSLDYKVESKRGTTGARIRNLGFITYTGGNVPPDPRPALGTALFSDLQGSQTVTDRGRSIDIGHALIGLETRDSWTMRSVSIPGMGGSGLEIVTWLGDLGGGVASLARGRVKKPSLSVAGVFSNKTSDYGVTDNLEGDAGGYLIAAGADPGGAPDYPSGKGIADAVASYLPLASAAQWSTRAARFAAALGAAVGPSGITNAKTLTDDLAGKLYDFAVWYAATRWIPSGELLGKDAQAACQQMTGAAREVATVFVTALSHAIAKSPAAIAASAPYPRPTPPGGCDSTLLGAASTDVGAVRKQLQEWRKDLSSLFQ